MIISYESLEIAEKLRQMKHEKGEEFIILSIFWFDMLLANCTVTLLMSSLTKLQYNLLGVNLRYPNKVIIIFVYKFVKHKEKETKNQRSSLSM